MSEELQNILIKAYGRWKDDPNPPVPLETIKEYLELEGISFEDIKKST
jgi:hypothetical protein